MTADHTLEATGLNLSYGDREVIRGLDLVVPPASIPAR